MKKRNSNKRIAILLIMILLTAAAPAVPVQAASATITVSTTNGEIRVGDTVEITLTIEADATIGDFEGYLSYDDTIFEFSSAASCITGGAGILRISDIGASPSAQERNYKIYFKAVDNGDCRVEIYDRPVVYAYSDGTEMSVTGFGKAFTVYPAYHASSDSSLSALHLVDSRIKTVELTPAFHPETKIYYASVPHESDGIIVSATASDRSATVQVTGDGEVELGTNTVCVTVTAEDGTNTEYTVHLYRAEEPTPLEPEDEEGGSTGENAGQEGDRPEMVLTPGITLEQSGGNVLVTEYNTYTFCEKPDSFQVPDGYVETTLLINEIQVTAYAKQETPAEEFLLLVLANASGQVNWYRYDRTEQTLQRVPAEEFVITEVVISNDAEWKAAIEQYELWQKGLNMAVAILSGICLFLLLLVTLLSVRNRRYKNER